ncbi:MAG: DUF4234 domain-containing protein [Lachnospiraceae bacterium]|jgi:nicotinamide riboside transporter PnuC|nr:DUF4234 domain-containing protein [Lachnospiraceae bacterium]
MYTGLTRNPVMVIVLSFITCGIYSFYWHYKAGDEIRMALGRPDAINPMLVIFSIICFPLMFYYIYTVDKALVELAAARGKPYTSNFVLWIVLCVLGIGLFVEMFMVQDTLNDIWADSAPVV